MFRTNFLWWIFLVIQTNNTEANILAVQFLTYIYICTKSDDFVNYLYRILNFAAVYILSLTARWDKSLFVNNLQNNNVLALSSCTPLERYDGSQPFRLKLCDYGWVSLFLIIGRRKFRKSKILLFKYIFVDEDTNFQ